MRAPWAIQAALAAALCCFGGVARADVLDIQAGADSVDARWWLPGLAAGAPEVSAALTARRDGDAAAEIELSQELGPVSMFLGRSQSLAATAGGLASATAGVASPTSPARFDGASVGSRPRAASLFAGLDWRVTERQRIGLDIEGDAHGARGERDRQLTISHSYAVDANLRWRLFVSRSPDRPGERWASGIRLAWRL